MLNTVIAFIEGPTLAVVLLVVVLIFGGKKIPELMHGIGKGIREFKEGMNAPEDDKKENKKEDDQLKS